MDDTNAVSIVHIEEAHKKFKFLTEHNYYGESINWYIFICVQLVHAPQTASKVGNSYCFISPI